MIRLIFFVILSALLVWFIAIYEAINLVFYEEAQASQYVHYLGIPVLIYLFIALFKDKYRYCVTDNKLWETTKHSVLGIIVLCVVYYAIIIPVVSGFIIMTDDVLPQREQLVVQGMVLDKVEIDGPEISNFELVIRTENEELILDTNGIEIDKYQIGDVFEVELKKGFWGLYSKKK
uniref:Uncharacterized protein n=1 Tax=Roseihalotalea indica TaxID=2867963 RepID=A0AA49JET5_9BACT|nr:hypothetical protein K4G66_17900 [Tunicatimonas sp. TK19036]